MDQTKLAITGLKVKVLSEKHKSITKIDELGVEMQIQ